MEGNALVNSAIDEAVKKYLQYKSTPENEEFHSFLVNVIKTLIYLYGELDIVNPYQTQTAMAASVFDTNLKKYGLSDQRLNDFKDNCLKYQENAQNIDILKTSFLEIQRILVEMFILKKDHVLISEEEEKEFQTYLYSKEDTDPLKLNLYNQLTPDSNEIILYYHSLLYSQKHKFVLTEYKDVALDKEAYQLAGYNIVEVMNMSEQEILNVNNKVYHFFRIKETDMNKRQRLESAIAYYKKYGNAITSGNGYVDMLLLSSVVATGLMVAIIIATKIAG